MTSRLSSRGTISSTSVLGVLPSAVTPVAQFYIVVSASLRESQELKLAYLFDSRRSGQLVPLEDAHALLRHVQVERELRTSFQNQLWAWFLTRRSALTLSRCSWYCGKLASISFMSFKFAAPSLPNMSDHRDRRPQLGGYDAPLETGVVLQELVEVRHELIDRLAHVHVPELRPDSVSVRQSRRLVLHPSLRLELVPERSNKKNLSNSALSSTCEHGPLTCMLFHPGWGAGRSPSPGT